MYDLSSVLDFDALTEVRPGSSILVSGPAMTGKEQFVYDVLADVLAEQRYHSQTFLDQAE